MRGEPEKQSLPNEGQDLPVLLSIPTLLNTHTHAHNFLDMSPNSFSLHTLASSLSSEPLPLRSDRGQHFSILQHTVCTLTDALTHTTSTLTLGSYSTSFIDVGTVTVKINPTSETVMQNEHWPFD